MNKLKVYHKEFFSDYYEFEWRHLRPTNDFTRYHFKVGALYGQFENASVDGVGTRYKVTLGHDKVATWGTMYKEASSDFMVDDALFILDFAQEFGIQIPIGPLADPIIAVLIRQEKEGA